MNSLPDRVYPVTQSSNASECDVTFERYCRKIVNYNSQNYASTLGSSLTLSFLSLLSMVIYVQSAYQIEITN